MRRIRLPSEAYEEGSTFSITIVTADRLPFFEDGDIVSMCLTQLRCVAERHAGNVYAYCFMPDHLHLLVEVRPGNSLVEFVRDFKQLTSYEFRHGLGHAGQGLWQRRFYDHALRSDEALETVAHYIWGNPVRAGLVFEQGQYPYGGSLVWDVPSGSEDPDLRGRDPPPRPAVGAGLQTRALMEAHSQTNREEKASWI